MHLASNNSVRTDYATAGDTVTLSFAVGVAFPQEAPLHSVEVFIAGRPAVSYVGGATLTIEHNTPEGELTFLAQASECAGNSGLCVATTDSSKVIVDHTAPTFGWVSLRTNNTANASIARVGDAVTLELNVTEPLSAAAVQWFNARTWSLVPQNATTQPLGWVFEHVVSAADAPGIVNFTALVRDRAGNEAAVVASTDNSTVTIVLSDTTSPTFAPTPFPSPSPTSLPSPTPSSAPSPDPTAAPSYHPTLVPSPSPTPQPSPAPSAEPTMSPEANPAEGTAAPSGTATTPPTGAPTAGPSPAPTLATDGITAPETGGGGGGGTVVLAATVVVGVVLVCIVAGVVWAHRRGLLNQSWERLCACLGVCFQPALFAAVPNVERGPTWEEALELRNVSITDAEQPDGPHIDSDQVLTQAAPTAAVASASSTPDGGTQTNASSDDL